ncbi:GIY-YIG nuclease family protein [Candidatus Omnitrophota bacterium]
MNKKGYVYLLTNRTNKVIYTGVTSNLPKRVYEHKKKLVKGFSKTYDLNKLVYYEIFDWIKDAIVREKQIKAGPRSRKIELIKSKNPNFKDLYYELVN